MNLPTPQGATGPGASGAASAWDRAADGWDRSTPLIHAWLAPATAAMLARLRLRPGARVLDLAAGAGDQTKDVAQAVGPTGHVLATDISPRILAFAQRNLGAAGLAHVRYAVADRSDREQPRVERQHLLQPFHREALQLAVAELVRARVQIEEVARDVARGRSHPDSWL